VNARRTGLFTATPPSIKLNSRTALVLGSVSVKCTGGRYVGAAAVAWHTSFTCAFSRGSSLALHDEKNTGCCSLVSKAGMMTDVRDVLKCGSPLMYFSRILSRPLDLYFGPLRALKFNRVSLNSPLSNNQKPNST
jgi:hypothetical protein